ncbi:MAG: hypothetical protein QW472_02910 [Candidatus Aenigmatarchaeota archaeon]
MNEFTLRFLVVGGIITIILGFGIWWFFIHNSSDKIAERNAYNLYQAIEYVCETGQEKELKFELEQSKIASLKDEVENGINWIKKKIGLGGPELEIPLQLYNDPYYKVYWEYFPPEPPYQFGQGALETMASVFIPWSEDLPWSSNFLLTVTLDSMFLGLDIFGLETAAEAGKKGTITLGRKIANKIRDKIESISPETFAKLRKAWNALENGADDVVENIGKLKRGVVKAGKFVVREGKFIGKVTAGYTLFCLATQDKTLGECLKEGVVVGIGADVAKITLQKFVIPKVQNYLKYKIAQTKREFSIKISDLKDKISSYFKEEVEESNELAELWKKKGWEYDSAIKKWRIARDFGDEAVENVINPLEEYARTNGWPDRIDDIFVPVYDVDEHGRVRGIKEVILDKDTFFEKIKKKILLPFEEKIARLKETVMSDKVLDSNSFSKIGKGMKRYFEENPDDAVEFLKHNGIKVTDKDEALRLISIKLSKLEKEADEGIFFAVMERGSKLEKLTNSIDERLYNLFMEGRAVSDQTILYETKNAVANYLRNDVLKDSSEAKNLWNLLNDKRLRLKEDAEIFSRGTLGYAILRIQDLYTPLGATYWDKYFSYYGYPSKVKPQEGYCQTSCQDGALCVQLGACVRAYPLKACQAKGINSIKLKRSSIVAPDPRFYLVSPCYSKLKIYQQGDTIYIEPYIPLNYNKKNYCYATGGLVNWYIGAEVGEYVAKCVSSALCAIGEIISTAGALAPSAIADVIKACFGFGPKFTGLCSVISEFVGLIVDVYRETQLIYPDAYRNNPTLIDFKIPNLN